MDRAILFGTFEFLGYSLCKALLDDGIQVNGFSIKGLEDSFIDEKRMEIGRNANFIENQIELEGKGNEDKIPFIISVYDLFYRNNEQAIMENKFFCDLIRKLKPKDCSVSLLLPEQYFLDSGEHYEPIDQLIGFLDKNGHSYQEIYLPALYGPWQPKEYFFQQLFSYIRKPIKFPTINNRESLTDAIYIDDAAQAVRKILGEERVMIKSGIENSWFTCLDTIMLDIENLCQSALNQELERIRKRTEERIAQQESADIKFIFLENRTNPSEGIRLQRKFYDLWSQTIVENE